MQLLHFNKIKYKKLHSYSLLSNSTFYTKVALLEMKVALIEMKVVALKK
jgi:hypothetical protein